MATTHILSKSTFMRGMQCEKSLWMYRHEFDKQDDRSPGLQAIFDQGSDVGDLAHDLFPGGVDLSPEYVNGIPRFGGSIARTRDAIRDGAPVLYEAAFVHEDVLAAVDLLVRDGARWRLIEVKSGTSISEAYAQDAALQHWVLRGAGLDLADVSIAHIDTSYVRRGAVDVNKLFAFGSVLELAMARLDDIGREVARLKEALARNGAPEVAIGPHCSAPYDCSFQGLCWEGFPEHSVFDVSYLGAKAWKLFDRGIKRAADIPDDFPLKRNQQIEVRCARTGEPHVDRDAVRTFVKTTEGPLYFLDFETCSPAVPLYDGTRPYQAIPFQYSLHCRRARGAAIEHKAFLGDGRTDPRAALAEQLLEDTRAEGRIVMYSGYERRILNELAEAFPERAAELAERNECLLDLSVPFRDHAYYTVEMDGKYSIKKVLPALVPGLSYGDMEIAEGRDAGRAYASLHTETDLEKIAWIRKALLDYCGLDTLAMVKLLEVLEGV